MRTRVSYPSPDPEEPERPIEDVLQGAAFELEPKRTNNPGIYSAGVIDNMVNNAQYELAWYFWSRIPELHYITRYISNALSLANLYVGRDGDGLDAPEQVSSRHPASQLMRNFAGGREGQSQLLDRLALHLTVAGDSILIGPKEGGGPPAPYNQWGIYSTNEVFSRNGQVFVRQPPGAQKPELELPNSARAVRIWRQHPQKWWEADSPVRSSFTVLRELDLLDQHVHASAVSRLAGAGLLLIPEEIDLPVDEVETEGVETDHFVKLLTKVMSLAIKNRESAAALVPIMLRGPAEYLSQVQQVNFSTPFSEQVPELRLGALRRLALGMDIPPEVLLGQGTSTSWSAWQTDESTLRVHLTPLLQLITSSLTVGWLRPALRSLPLSDAQAADIDNLVVAYDLSRLQIRQDVSGDAQALYDRGVIDEDALRRALGFSANSKPTNEEQSFQILLQMVRENPSMAAYAINALRDNFGLSKWLPEAEEPEAQIGRPAEPSDPATTEVGGPLPGERSQDRQVDAPSPPADPSDPDNNSVGG